MVAERMQRHHGAQLEHGFSGSFLVGYVTLWICSIAMSWKIVPAMTGIRDRQGRLFLLKIGDSAANASHAITRFPQNCEPRSPANSSRRVRRVDYWMGLTDFAQPFL